MFFLPEWHVQGTFYTVVHLESMKNKSMAFTAGRLRMKSSNNTKAQDSINKAKGYEEERTQFETRNSLIYDYP